MMRCGKKMGSSVWVWPDLSCSWWGVGARGDLEIRLGNGLGPGAESSGKGPQDLVVLAVPPDRATEPPSLAARPRQRAPSAFRKAPSFIQAAAARLPDGQ